MRIVQFAKRLVSEQAQRYMDRMCGHSGVFLVLEISLSFRKL